MRWNLVKEAWSLARKKFPDTKRLFVDLPEKFRCEGQCAIYDLDKPDEPIGVLKYRAKMADQQPVIIVSLGGMEATAGIAQFGSIDLPVSSAERQLAKKASINAQDINARYPDPSLLGEQVAYLVLGHEDGPLYKAAEKRISSHVLAQWGRVHGFTEQAMVCAREQLENMGVEVSEPSTFNLKTAKRPKKKEFENFQKVRITEPKSMELNEGGQIIDHKRNEQEDDFYLVIVDGSSVPSWYREDQIEKNDVSGAQNLTPSVPNE